MSIPTFTIFTGVVETRKQKFQTLFSILFILVCILKNITINYYCLLSPKIYRTTIIITFNISGEPRIDSLL